jgi:anti-anti-sigma factor
VRFVAQSCKVDAGGERFFRLVGELDGTSADGLARALTCCTATSGDVVLDLLDLAGVDCAGARAFVGIAQQLDGELILLSPRPQVAQVLRGAGIAGLPNVVVFPTHDPSARRPAVLHDPSPQPDTRIPIVPI